MRNFVLSACIIILGSTGLFASGGGVTGGWGSTNPHLIIGERVMEPSELRTDAAGNIVLQDEQMLDVLKGSMRNERLVVNGEEVEPIQFSFSKARLMVRSIDNPSCKFLLRGESPSPQ